MAVANRQDVTFSLDPFRPEAPTWSLTMPLFAFLFMSLGVGIIVGGFATWLRQARWRHTARAERAVAERLRQEVERLTQRGPVAAHLGRPRERDAA
jgi:hypothetical protein